MKFTSIACAAICLLMLRLMVAGCSAISSQPPAPLDAPIAVESFAFMARGMTTADIYSYTAEKEENGTHLHLELNCGYTVIDVTVEEDVLRELGTIAAEYRLDLWDGFDKSKKNVSDGEGFTLSITAEDGRSIYARGSNAFPDNYSDARRAIDELFNRLIEEYGNM